MRLFEADTQTHLETAETDSSGFISGLVNVVNEIWIPTVTGPVGTADRDILFQRLLGTEAGAVINTSNIMVTILPLK